MNRDDIRYYLDSTYLQTAETSGLSETQVRKEALATVAEALKEGFRLAMIRPEHVADAAAMVRRAKTKTLIGTVIDFPDGDGGLEAKLDQAERALDDGADELDFVCDYKAFRAGDAGAVVREVLACTQLVLARQKTLKWIIETAALSDGEIVRLTALIRNTVIRHVKEDRYGSVYLKSSTGFFMTPDGRPNGATPEAIIMMLENASPLPVKASGGIRDLETARQYIRMGVQRIGTSSAKTIASGGVATTNY